MKYQKLQVLLKKEVLMYLITRLRQKIEPDTKNPKYLQTVRGAGYVLWID